MCIIMEYVEGGDLRSFLQAIPEPPEVDVRTHTHNKRSVRDESCAVVCACVHVRMRVRVCLCLHFWCGCVQVVMRWFIALLEGLAHIHSKSIVHRDLKPANILVSNANELKIADFGVSKQVHRPTVEVTTFTSVTCPAQPRMLPHTCTHVLTLSLTLAI